MIRGLIFDFDGLILHIRHAPLPAVVDRRLVVALREAVPRVCFAVEQGLRFGQGPRIAALRPGTGTS